MKVSPKGDRALRDCGEVVDTCGGHTGCLLAWGGQMPTENDPLCVHSAQEQALLRPGKSEECSGKRLTFSTVRPDMSVTEKF